MDEFIVKAFIFILGAIVGGVVVFFVCHNNQKKANELFEKGKAEFDAKEKELRSQIEDLKLEEKVKAYMDKMKG